MKDTTALWLKEGERERDTNIPPLPHLSPYQNRLEQSCNWKYPFRDWGVNYKLLRQAL